MPDDVLKAVVLDQRLFELVPFTQQMALFAFDYPNILTLCAIRLAIISINRARSPRNRLLSGWAASTPMVPPSSM